MKQQQKHILYCRGSKEEELEKKRTFSSYKAAVAEGAIHCGYGMFLVESFRREEGQNEWQPFAPEPISRAEILKIFKTLPL